MYCPAEKKIEKFRSSTNEYHYTRYDLWMSYFCVVSFHCCIFLPVAVLGKILGGLAHHHSGGNNG